MIALVTGATSGLGKDMAILFAKERYNIIAVARNKEKLESIKEKIEKKYSVKVDTFRCDVSDKEAVTRLHEDVKKKYGTIDVLINNAGFGDCGFFTETDSSFDASMIETNVLGMHLMFKLFLKDMKEANKGHILNVASIAGFMPGPLMATYYASKAYVVRLSQAVQYELKVQESDVKVSVLCPGPVDTNFNNVANVKFSLKGDDSRRVALKAINGMFKGKEMIFSSTKIKLAAIGSKFLSYKTARKICFGAQKKKISR